MTVKEGYIPWGGKRPEGWFFAHNHILHAPNSHNGDHGFRAFYIPDKKDWLPCPCGWHPEKGVHYAAPDHVATYADPVRHAKRLRERDADDRARMEPITAEWKAQKAKAARRK
jgi:hypothetical protein